MPKATFAAIAVAALWFAPLALAAPAAQAQAISVPNAAPQGRLLTVALTTQTGGMRASRMIGSTVYDVQNRNIGSVKDIVFDGDGRIQAVVVDVGAFLGVGGKYVAVNLDELKTENDRLTLNRSKEQLQAARSYQLDNRQ